MPYRRKYKKKNCPKSKWAGYADTASKALTIAKRVASLINVEYKYYDTLWNSAGAGTGGNIAALCIPQQGDTDTTRNGDSIRMKNLTFNWTARHNNLGNPVQVVRFAIIKSMLPNGAGNPAVLDVYDEANGLTLMNIEKSPNYSVLYSKTVCVSTEHNFVKLSDYIKLGEKGTICKFDGNTGAATDVQKNLLFVMVFSDEVVNAAIHSFRGRVRYIDN